MRDSPRTRAGIPGRATAPTRSERATLWSRRTRTTARWGARPTSAARPTRRCSRNGLELLRARGEHPQSMPKRTALKTRTYGVLLESDTSIRVSFIRPLLY